MPGSEGKTPKIACYVKKTGIVYYVKKYNRLLCQNNNNFGFYRWIDA